MLPTTMTRCWRQSSSGSIGSGVRVSCTASASRAATPMAPTIANAAGDRLPPCTSTTISAVIATISSSEPR